MGNAIYDEKRGRWEYEDEAGTHFYTLPALVSGKKAIKKVEAQEISQMTNKSFTPDTRNGRIAIVTAWVLGVLAWAALFTFIQVTFPWSAPWLWTCFTFGLIPAGLATWLSMGVYQWIQDGDWEWLSG